MIGVKGLEMILEVDGVRGVETARAFWERFVRCGVTGAKGRRSDMET